MKITIEIPALDRLNTILESHPALLGGTPAANPTPAPDKEAETPKPAKAPKGAKPPKKEEAPAHTLETLTTLGKKLISVSSPSVLRAALDEAGLKGRKLGEATADEYPAIAEAIEAALAENDLG